VNRVHYSLLQVERAFLITGGWIGEFILVQSVLDRILALQFYFPFTPPFPDKIGPGSVNGVLVTGLTPSTGMIIFVLIPFRVAFTEEFSWPLLAFAAQSSVLGALYEP